MIEIQHYDPETKLRGVRIGRFWLYSGPDEKIGFLTFERWPGGLSIGIFGTAFMLSLD